MRNADHGVYILQCAHHKLICQYTRCVVEAEQAMVCEHCPDAHQVGVQDPFMAYGRQTCVRVDEMDMLPKKNRAQIRKGGKEVWKRCRGGNREKGDVVDFEAGEEPADADASLRMAVGYYYYLVMYEFDSV